MVGGVAGARLAGRDAPDGVQVALLPLPGAPTSERATVVLPGRRGGDVRLRVEGARPTAPGHVEEVWFMTDATKLVSVGSYRVGSDGEADVTFHTAEDPAAYRYVDVSLEPTDGNPAHSAKSLLRSRALH